MIDKILKKNRDGYRLRGDSSWKFCNAMVPIIHQAIGQHRRSLTGSNRPKVSSGGRNPKKRNQREKKSEKQQDSPLASIIRFHDHGHVLHRDDNDEGPDNNRKNAEDILGVYLDPLWTDNAGPHRAKRAGANITEYDPESRQG